jgi:dienelactone hydrolase
VRTPAAPANLQLEGPTALTPLKSDPARPKEELEKAQGAVFGGTVGPWLGRQGDDVVRPRINKVVDAVSGESGVETVGAVGFCWCASRRIVLMLG